jgi:outer membrane immunogenic protein
MRVSAQSSERFPDLNLTEASMKRLPAAGVAVFALMAPAMAADISTSAPIYSKAPAPWTWTGFYIGGTVGGQRGTDSITSGSDPIGWTPAGAASIDGSSATSIHPQGFIGGVEAGYNWQINSFVLGLEADMNWLSGTATRNLTLVGIPGLTAGDVMTNMTHVPFLATVRPRLGVTFDHALLYVTGGLAIGTLQTTDSFLSLSPATVTQSSSLAGWTVGGGLEYAITRNWSVKGEYLHVDLGNANALIPTCAACVAGSDIMVNHKYTEEIARFGANFKFDD